ncbi:Ku protein [Cellulomonas fimi]|uniref:Non-homologous end joining protein Ku n=1 Tax=Cellulomonas fimi TaxID=1708 RepID=A0A7Y0M0I5_CELFI|nr:Ku protein [Cellulomonas fimi]NMR21593.1 Ku protein [Cellulomonas fimi]
MRAIWKGAVAFGLVNVPVKLYAATGEHQVPLHQVHREDGGRIRYKKVCSVCGEPVEMSDIAKGYQTDDGELVVLTDADFAELPLATEREISVLEFVPAEQVDPILLAKTYYLEPEKTAAKPYALLREALVASDRMAVVKVALRQRESMAVLRVRDDVICLQTLLWPDEIREADFPVLDSDVSVRPQELKMASSLVESLAADFDPSQFEDRYQAALEEMIEAKVTAGSTQPVPVPEGSVGGGAEGGGEVIDLLAALQRSVEKARGARGGTDGATSGTGDDAADAGPLDAAVGDQGSARSTATKAASKKPSRTTASKSASAGSSDSRPTGKASAAKPSASKAAASKTAASRSAASKTTASKTTASKATASKTAAPKATSAKASGSKKSATASDARTATKSTSRRRAS